MHKRAAEIAKRTTQSLKKKCQSCNVAYSSTHHCSQSSTKTRHCSQSSTKTKHCSQSSTKTKQSNSRRSPQHFPQQSNQQFPSSTQHSPQHVVPHSLKHSPRQSFSPEQAPPVSFNKFCGFVDRKKDDITTTINMEDAQEIQVGSDFSLPETNIYVPSPVRVSAPNSPSIQLSDENPISPASPAPISTSSTPDQPKGFTVDTSDPSRVSYVCNTCQQSYTLRNSMRRHLLNHIAPRFECDACGQKFRERYLLTTHMIKKHGGPPQSIDNI